MKKALIAVMLAGIGVSFAHAATTSGPATATWKATAKKDSSSALEVTPLGSLSFQYAEGLKGFNTVDALFDVSIQGDADATDFTLKAKKLSGTLNHMSGGSSVEVGVMWQGLAVSTNAYTTLIDTAAGVTGGNLAPLAAGFKDDTQRTTSQGAFSFNIEHATVNGADAEFNTLPDGLWEGQVNVEFVASWA